MKQFVFPVIALLLIAFHFGCKDNSTITTKAETAIEGQVFSIGSPAVTDGWTPPPLEKVSTIVVLDDARRSIGEYQTDQKGKFKIAFSQGEYFLRVKESMLPAETGPFQVKQGEIAAAQAHYDNGMR